MKAIKLDRAEPIVISELLIKASAITREQFSIMRNTFLLVKKLEIVPQRDGLLATSALIVIVSEQSKKPWIITCNDSLLPKS